MRNGIKLAVATMAAVATWAIAIDHMRHAPPDRRSTEQVQGYAQTRLVSVLDESQSAERPIAYPLLSAASAQIPLAGFTVTSEHGIVTVRAIGSAITPGDVIEATQRLALPTEGVSLSAMPAYDSGSTIWTGKAYDKSVDFQTVTTDTNITFSTGDGRPLWRLRAPPAQFTLRVDARHHASFSDAHGRTLWTGTTSSTPNGMSCTASGGSSNIKSAGIDLHFQGSNALSLTCPGSPTWNGRTAGPVSILRLDEPGFTRTIVLADPVGERPVVLTWGPGVHIRTSISIHHGIVSVTGLPGGVSPHKPIDIGTMTTRYGPSIHNSAMVLVTPIAPLYVDGAVIHASYSLASGSPLCDESIAYGKTPLSTTQATVTRSLEWRPQPAHSPASGDVILGRVTVAYSAPWKPRSTKWNW